MHRSALILLLMGSAAAGAQPGLEARGADDRPGSELDFYRVTPGFRVSLLWENDSAFHTYFSGTDRYFTNGVRASVAWQPEFAYKAASALPFADHFSDMRAAFGLTLGQNMYTPADLTAPELRIGDQPYAGWLYGGAFLQRTDGVRFDHLELDVGVVGEWSHAAETQKFIHKHFQGVDPKGWDNQLDNEVGFNLSAQRAWRISTPPVIGLETQAIPHAGFVLGTINRHAHAGVTVRAGFNLPDDFGPGRLDQVESMTGEVEHAYAGYVFARAGARLVDHNIFVEGSDTRGGPRVDPKAFVGEVQLGFQLQITRHFEFRYTHSLRGEEFDGQEGPQRTATYGVNLRFRF